MIIIRKQNPTNVVDRPSCCASTTNTISLLLFGLTHTLHTPTYKLNERLDVCVYVSACMWEQLEIKSITVDQLVGGVGGGRLRKLCNSTKSRRFSLQ